VRGDRWLRAKVQKLVSANYFGRDLNADSLNFSVFVTKHGLSEASFKKLTGVRTPKYLSF